MTTSKVGWLFIVLGATAFNTIVSYMVATCVFSVVASDAMIHAAIVGIVTFVGTLVIVVWG